MPTVDTPVKHKPHTILQAATLLFDQEGVGVSTAKVAKAAGVSNGTLFNYFPTKQDLLDALYVGLKQRLTTAIGVIDPDQPIEGQVRQVWFRWLEWAIANPVDMRVAALLHTSGLASPEAVQTADSGFGEARGVLARAIEQGALADLPAPHIAALIQIQLELAASAGLDEEQQEAAFQVMWRGITKP